MFDESATAYDKMKIQRTVSDYTHTLRYYFLVILCARKKNKKNCASLNNTKPFSVSSTENTMSPMELLTPYGVAEQCCHIVCITHQHMWDWVGVVDECTEHPIQYLELKNNQTRVD